MIESIMNGHSSLKNEHEEAELALLRLIAMDNSEESYIKEIKEFY